MLLTDVFHRAKRRCHFPKISEYNMKHYRATRWLLVPPNDVLISYNSRCKCGVYKWVFFPPHRCFSYIGRVFSGGQVLSIGQYCDGISTVEHEFLHALGFYHEQSRNDRDDFVTIVPENILEGLFTFVIILRLLTFRYFSRHQWRQMKDILDGAVSYLVSFSNHYITM